MNRPKLDLIFDCTAFAGALVGLICFAFADADPILLGFSGGLASVCGGYAIKSVILWRKFQREQRHTDWIHCMRDMVQQRHTVYLGDGLYVVRHRCRRAYNVNWKRDGF
jgi:hypothetical protein